MGRWVDAACPGTALTYWAKWPLPPRGSATSWAWTRAGGQLNWGRTTRLAKSNKGGRQAKAAKAGLLPRQLLREGESQGDPSPAPHAKAGGSGRLGAPKEGRRAGLGP